MKMNAKEVIGFVSDKMGISLDEAQRDLCITDKETVISIQPDRGRYQHPSHPRHTCQARFREYPAFPQFFSGPPYPYRADFYREWYKQKVALGKPA
jgi:hypothetical protein